MKCTSPFVKHGRAHGCGQCLPCRINRRRVWKHRILLEAAGYADNAFLTLTYRSEALTTVNGGSSSNDLATLVPMDLSNWLKRFRKTLEPLKVRFFACGEYGDESWRPHYHAIIFGFPTCERGRTKREVASNRSDWSRCCPNCELVGRTWGLGDVELGEVAPDSAQYVARYTVKKLNGGMGELLQGRHPEFARMSRMPGIGAPAMHDVASVLLSLSLDETQADVPSALRHGAKMLPLGRYLKSKLRLYCGKEVDTPEEVLAEIFEKEVRPLLEAAKTSKEAPSLKSQMALKNAPSELRLRLLETLKRKPTL